MVRRFNEADAHRLLQRQGVIFCVIAVFCLAGMPWLNDLSDTRLLPALAVAIVVLGVPHGALDPVFARSLYRVRTPFQWLLFIIGYVLLGSLVVLTWWVAPTIFLAVFLLISAVHFSGDLAADLPLAARLCFGCAIIALPTLFHAARVDALFSSLAGVEAATIVSTLLQAIALPVLLGNCLLIFLLRRNRVAAGEVLCAVLLAVWMEPLSAFIVYFCALHGPRHILRTASLVGIAPLQLLYREALLPTLACLAAVIGAMMILTDLPASVRTLRIVFVGLAALTVPHMALVEQLRHRHWRSAAR